MQQLVSSRIIHTFERRAHCVPGAPALRVLFTDIQIFSQSIILPAAPWLIQAPQNNFVPDELLSNSLECLIQIPDNILSILCSDGKTDCVLVNADILQLLLVQLGVCCCSRVNNQGLNVRNISQQREYRQVVDELLCVSRGALDLKREDRAAAVREVLLILNTI